MYGGAGSWSHSHLASPSGLEISCPTPSSTIPFPLGGWRVYSMGHLFTHSLSIIPEWGPLSFRTVKSLFLLSYPSLTPLALEIWVRIPTPPQQPLHARWINEVMSPKNLEFLGRKASTCGVLVIAITSLSRVSQLSWWKRGQQNKMPASPNRGAAGVDYKRDLCARFPFLVQAHQTFSMPSSPLDNPAISLSQTGVGKDSLWAPCAGACLAGPEKPYILNQGQPITSAQ